MKKYNNFTKDKLLEVFRLMILSRTIDEKMVVLLKQGKAHFTIQGPGHEAAQIGAGLNFIPGKDWAFPYYRDQALVLTWKLSVEEILLHFLGKKDDPCSGGRQMPYHWSKKELRIVTQSACTGTQLLQAVGCAHGIKLSRLDEVVYVSIGDGTTSQGEFHEALNWASREKLPVVFHVEDNHYAISVPREQQTAEGSIYNLVNGYLNLDRKHIDGTNFFEVYEAFKSAVERARNNGGPSIIISDVVRLYPHSSSDDHKKYKSPEEIELDRRRDPITQMYYTLIQNEIATESELENIKKEIKEYVDKTAEWAIAQPDPEPESAIEKIYVSWLEPQEEIPPKSTAGKVVMIDAINHALHEEMQINDKIIVYGEDVADPKGGVFGATKGLSDRFGNERVFNSPLAEASIVGTAIGLAYNGYKPVVEIQFMDYIFPAFMQIRNELATSYYRSNGVWICDVVIRATVGGYIQGGLYHSQCAEALFAHTPGLRVVFPSNASDAKGLLKSAIRGKDPVIFCEHKAIYRLPAGASEEPDSDYIIPLGKAKVVQEGDDLTVITWGLMVHLVKQALNELKDVSPSVEIIDIRTLNPLDMDTILKSVRKTGKVLIVYEDNFTGGFGAEISARIASDSFEYLDGPVQRVASKDVHIPFAYNLERYVLPSVKGIAEKMKEVLLY